MCNNVKAADIVMNKLACCYKGIVYNSIPKKEASNTGMSTLDTTVMKDDKRKMLMLDLENWIDEVYNKETDNLLFDDESLSLKRSLLILIMVHYPRLRAWPLKKHS